MRTNLLLGIALSALVLSRLASAALGEAANSIDAEQATWNATVQVRSIGNFRVSELTTAAGIVMRQYVSPAGRVFAVAWQGPQMPDLRLLLGRYFDQFVTRAADRGHRQRAIHEAELVVQSGGHPRSFAGRAYLPKYFPPGVTADFIR
jgi:Protein of unknown function (DUF2844)